MPYKTKRQLQVSKIPRKKGHYLSKDQAKTEIEAVESEKWMDNKNIDEWTEGKNQIDDEYLNEFEKVEKKLIIEVLC